MILVTGKNGQVGSALVKLFGSDVVAIDSKELNLAEPNLAKKLDTICAGKDITAVINAAAYTQVDKAESERELANRINGRAVGEIAAWCAERDIPLVHYSTDYVYDGSGNKARTESEPVAPLNAYGESKLFGEELIQKSGAKYLIFRTSWVYDETGKNFLNTMLRLFREREEVKVVADQIGAPTYAAHLAKATLTALNNALGEDKFPSGVYHLCGAGETSWHGFAQAIFALASARESGIKCTSVQPITSDQYPTPARRPRNSRLDCTKATEVLSVTLPHWQEALTECYESIRLRD